MFEMDVQDIVQGVAASAGPDYQQRQDALRNAVYEKHGSTGSIFLFAAREEYNKRFVQDSTFYYFTGLQMPGLVLELDVNGGRMLYVPQFGEVRKQWVAGFDLSKQQVQDLGYEYAPLGERIVGLHLFYMGHDSAYRCVYDRLQQAVQDKESVFTLSVENKVGLQSLSLITMQQACQAVQGLEGLLIDVSVQVAHLREVKTQHEIEYLYKAIEITDAGLQAAAHMIKPGAFESELQAATEYLFTEYMAYPAYPTIVGSGKNATVLHYDRNAARLDQNQAILIDAGARFDYYCADITRVYPNKKFTDKQKSVYQVVLDAQAHVASHIRPGMWLFNAQDQEKSLHHIGMKFLQDQGYKDACPHGIGHMLGLDVHDVHDRTRPLQAGNVITIEPGLYMPDQDIGVRIEDNYWVVDGEAVCLSDHIIKEIDDVEQLVAQTFAQE